MESRLVEGTLSWSVSASNKAELKETERPEIDMPDWKSVSLVKSKLSLTLFNYIISH